MISYYFQPFWPFLPPFQATLSSQTSTVKLLIICKLVIENFAPLRLCMMSAVHRTECVQSGLPLSLIKLDFERCNPTKSGAEEPGCQKQLKHNFMCTPTFQSIYSKLLGGTDIEGWIIQGGSHINGKISKWFSEKAHYIS